MQRRRRPRLAETADQLPGGLGTDASSEDPAQDVSERIATAARLATDSVAGEGNVAVVVSAMAGVTDALIEA
ncbi:MAG: hypothetical protein ACYTGO_20045, partial [Planctomycetota bacterium]